MQTDVNTPDATALPVVVFGRDDKGKPHASRFEATEAPLAEKAAGLMGMQVLRIASDDAAALAASLPLGRIFSSGRGFVPFVKAELFAKLAATPGTFMPPRPADIPVTPPGAAVEPLRLPTPPTSRRRVLTALARRPSIGPA